MRVVVASLSAGDIHTRVFVVNEHASFAPTHQVVLHLMIWVLGRLGRIVEQIGLSDHHRRVVTIPLAFGVLVRIPTSQNLLLKLFILKLRLLKHVLPILVALVK